MVSIQTQGCWTASFEGIDVGRPLVDGCGPREFGAARRGSTDAVLVTIQNKEAGQLSVSLDCGSGVVRQTANGAGDSTTLRCSR